MYIVYRQTCNDAGRDTFYRVPKSHDVSRASPRAFYFFARVLTRRFVPSASALFLPLPLAHNWHDKYCGVAFLVLHRLKNAKYHFWLHESIWLGSNNNPLSHLFPLSLPPTPNSVVEPHGHISLTQ
jgi:hypothetical protein